MFERTKSGQQNRAIFFQTDLICYVEGGGGANTHAADVTFWKQVFLALRPDLKVKFAPRGGKPILQKLALEIIQNDLMSTFVAMDSDYDDFRGKKIADSRILYTYGYSWENDIFCQQNITKVYAGISHCDDVREEVKEYFASAYSDIDQKLNRAIYADYLAVCGGSSILPRETPGRVVGTDHTSGLPIVKKSELLKLCSVANNKTKLTRTPPPNCTIDSLRHCVGHVLSHTVNIILRAAIRQFYKRNSSLSTEHIRDVGLQTFYDLLTEAQEHLAVQHYTHACAALK